MTKPRLTTDEKVLAAIRELTAMRSMPPTIRELQQQLKVGSTRTVLRYLNGLEAAGSIERWPGARGVRIKGWMFYHEYDAELVRRDGLMCEQHPGMEFAHDPDCAGPGTAWMIAGKDNILRVIKTQRNSE